VAFGRVIKRRIGRFFLRVADGDGAVEPSRSVFSPCAGQTLASNFEEGLDGCK